MYGVVLWSDKTDKKAVIWCEDHGDLAFYSAMDQAPCSKEAMQSNIFDGFSLDAGDLVQFEIREERHLRYAVSPTLIAEDEYPNLAQGLNQANAPVNTGANGGPAFVQDQSAEIVQFENAAQRIARSTKSNPSKEVPLEI